MAEGARLESVYTFIAYRGFESLSLRQTTHPIWLLTSEIQGEIVAGMAHMAFMANVGLCLGKYNCFLKLVGLLDRCKALPAWYSHRLDLRIRVC